MLTLRTLGAWGLRFGDAQDSEADSSPSKTLGFLVYVASSPGATARRERLVDLLWAHMEPEAGDHALRQVVWHFRNQFGDDAIRSTAGALTLTCPFECDRTAFLEAIEKQDFETAVRVYGGDFLPGFAAPGGAEFERWADLERRRLRSLFLLACESLTHSWLAAGRFRDATAVARRARDADRDSEAGWRLLLEALLASGDSVSAAVEAEELKRTLADDRRTPEPATAAAIRRALNEQPQAALDPGASLVSELVGREREFTAITARWELVRAGRGCHVHVEGAAGLGKTRLLHDVAARLRASGATVVEARANPGEREVRYAFAAEMAAALAELPGSGAVSPASADALVALNPRLSSRYVAASGARVAADSDARVFALALWELVEAVSEEGPLAVTMDDMHWADAASRNLDAALFPRLASRRVLVVTSARPGAEGRIEGPETLHLSLSPLTADEVGMIVSAAGTLPEAEWATGLTQALYRSTLGTPLLIVETLRLALSRELLHLSEGQWGSADPVALFGLLAQGGALHKRIVDLTRERRWLLVLLAVAGVPLTQDVLASATRRPEPEMLADLDELNRLGLATRAGVTWVPAHDAIAERLLELATQDQQVAAHGALGKALAAQPEEAAGLRSAVHHLRAGGAEPETASAAARWVRMRRTAGDTRATAILVAELVGVPPGDPSAQRLARALPLRVRVRKGRAIAAAALLALGGAAVAVAVVRSAPADIGLTIGQWRPEATHWRLYARHITQKDLAAGRVALASLRRTRVVNYDRTWGELRPGSPDVLLTAIAFRDSGGEDIVVGNGERYTRLTYARGDDYDGAWSPDGRLITFPTDRWDNQSQSSIAVMSPDRPDSLRRLSFGGVSRDATPAWSPDGTRIAFVRTYLLARRPYEMCVATVDATWQRCLRLAGYSLQGFAGWSTPSELVGIFRDSTSHTHLIAVDLESGGSREIADGAGSRASRTPGWLVCLCRRTRDEPLQLLVISTKTPGWALRLEPAAAPEDILLYAPDTRDYLDSLSIVNVSDTIPTGGRWQLGLKAWDAAAQPREPLSVRWWSADTLIATVDSSGFVYPRRPGRVVIHASAGGWRETSAGIGIREVAPAMVIAESWHHGIGSQWVPFGTPQPFLTRFEGVAGLAPNGDSTYTSGVYARQLIPTREGVGVEFTASTPITFRQWQKLLVSILTADQSTAQGWDLVRGQLAIPNEYWRGCNSSYPAMALDRLELVNGNSRSVRVPPATVRGRWTRYRLQLFPDGRCGIAINGEPRAVLDRALPLADSVMVLIRGNSYHTRILVGPLEIWRGVRRDVDWSKAEATQQQ